MGEILEKYMHIENAEQMLDAGIKPMNSSDKFSLIASLRLKALKEKLTSDLSDGSTGKWIPAIVKDYAEGESGWISKKSEVAVSVETDMRFKAKKDYRGNNIKGLEGKVVDVSDSRGTVRIGVEFDEPVTGGDDLGGKAEYGRGYWLTPEYIKIYSEGGMFNGYRLAPGVKASKDESLSHLVRFSKEFNAEARDSGGSRTKVRIPQGSIGILRENSNDILDIKFNEKIDNKTVFKFGIDDLEEILEVSSNGAYEPKDIETTVYEEAMYQFYPRTRLDTETAALQLIPILSGVDMIDHGPPGSGKSQVAKDMLDIFLTQEVIFKVKGCQSNCNPYSLIDKEFAKQVQPCDECCTNYNGKEGGTFLEDRIFIQPDPRDVPVTVAMLGVGSGLEKVGGNTAINHMDLAGWKMPNGDQDVDQTSLKGMTRGKIPRSNNGMLFVDEIDKIPRKALHDFLMAISDDVISQNQVRYDLPAHSFVIGTANDPGMIPEPLNDRMFMLPIRYPENKETCHLIIRAAYFGEYENLDDVPIGDMHQLDPINLLHTPIPYIASMTSTSLMQKAMKDYNGPGYKRISASNRSRQDALRFASARHHTDRIFFRDTPSIVGLEYIKEGLKIALKSRVCEEEQKAENEAFRELDNFVESNFQDTYNEERDVYWCETNKQIANLAEKGGEVFKDNFIAELEMYDKNPKCAVDIYDQVLKAYNNPGVDRMQRSRFQYPFMDYLFSNKMQGQPLIREIDEDKQVIELLEFYAKSRIGAACRV